MIKDLFRWIKHSTQQQHFLKRWGEAHEGKIETEGENRYAKTFWPEKELVRIEVDKTEKVPLLFIYLCNVNIHSNIGNSDK